MIYKMSKKSWLTLSQADSSPPRLAAVRVDGEVIDLDIASHFFILKLPPHLKPFAH